MIIEYLDPLGLGGLGRVMPTSVAGSCLHLESTGSIVCQPCLSTSYPAASMVNLDIWVCFQIGYIDYAEAPIILGYPILETTCMVRFYARILKFPM